MWAYGYMLGWKVSKNIQFDFRNAHELKPAARRCFSRGFRHNRLKRIINSRVSLGVRSAPLVAQMFLRGETLFDQKLGVIKDRVVRNGQHQISLVRSSYNRYLVRSSRTSYVEFETFRQCVILKCRAIMSLQFARTVARTIHCGTGGWSGNAELKTVGFC